jgi:hypothetical protein
MSIACQKSNWNEIRKLLKMNLELTEDASICDVAGNLLRAWDFSAPMLDVKVAGRPPIHE